jgi:ATP-grasp domain, R2K clade family 3
MPSFRASFCVTVHILYPSDPYNPRQADDFYERERLAANAATINTSVFSLEEFEAGRWQVKPPLRAGATVVYRGWMLRAAAYERLAEQVARDGARLLTSPSQYALTHHLPAWYRLLEEFTPSTRFFVTPEDAIRELDGEPGPFFVKDWVKSLSTGRGSVAQRASDITQIASDLERYRGSLEGGLCVRDFESFVEGSEHRYFVVKAQVFSPTDATPDVVRTAATRVSSPFFAVDVVTRTDGVQRVVELGDGQVSDLKEWSLARFQRVLGALAASESM